ncbi:Ig-like domain-containing protein [Myxococcota bacterium]|nr:Ig-like domain-containing protein [Myxococcota bacterium]
MTTTVLFSVVLALACGDKDQDDTGPVGDGGGTGVDGGTDGGGATDGGGTTADGGGTADGGTTECTASFVGITPADGELYAALDTVVEVVLSEPDPTAVLVLTDEVGTPVAGTLDVSDATISFTPSAPLLADLDYTVQFTWCLGQVETSFGTYAESDPLGWDPRGVVWALDVEEMDWLQPERVGGLLLGATNADMLITVDTYDSQWGMFWGWSTYDVTSQDECIATTAPEPIGVETLPDFTMGPVDGTFNVGGVPARMLDMVLSGRVGAELAPLQSIRLTGTADLRMWREVFELVGLEGPDEVCELLQGAGDPCIACDDGALYCVPIEGTATSASRVTLSIVPRTSEEIAHDPECTG